jgi:hypothetical protein
MPTAVTIAERVSLPTNDPRPTNALAVALSWARTTLSRPVDDPLGDLNESGNDAIAGFAADVLRAPAVQAALMAGTIDYTTIPVDVGRRWELALCRGNKKRWGVA